LRNRGALLLVRGGGPSLKGKGAASTSLGHPSTRLETRAIPICEQLRFFTIFCSKRRIEGANKL
jgi:hypothetical protein